MALSGSLIKRAGTSRRGQRIIKESPALAELSRNFLAGEDVPEALRTLEGLRAEFLLCSVHLQDTAVLEVATAAAQVAVYRDVLDGMQDQGLITGSEISVTLEQLGLYTSGGFELATANLHEIAVAAEQVGCLVTLDMQWPQEVDQTLAALAEVRGDVPSLGIALQSYLPRTQADCESLAGQGSRVRLCKGAYRNKTGMTYATSHEVDRSYVRCLRALMHGQCYPMVATHDDRLIRIALSMAESAGRKAGQYEFQMLQGIRTSEQLRLAELGEVVRVYLVFGPDCYSWFVGRVAERPANLVTLARSVDLPGLRRAR